MITAQSEVNHLATKELLSHERRYDQRRLPKRHLGNSFGVTKCCPYNKIKSTFCQSPNF